MSLSVWVVATSVLILYYLLPIIVYLKCNKNTRRIILVLLLISYIIALIVGVWARVKINHERVLIEFEYNFSQQKVVNWSFSELKFSDVFINLVMLLPIGMAVGAGCHKQIINKVAVGLLIGLAIGAIIEIGQYLLPVERAPQLSDVTFNAIGLGCGALIGGVMHKLRPDNGGI